MSEIQYKKTNELLESTNQRAFHQRTIQHLMCLILEAWLLPAGTYNTPSMEIFDVLFCVEIGVNRAQKISFLISHSACLVN